MISLSNHPAVSILIPVFNRKDYITGCIQSALDQTFTDFEVVVVDNASDDGTWEICQEFALADQRIRIFRNELNIGPVRNWIRCVQESKGNLSKILFSDDCLEPNCLSEMVPKLGDLDVALVYCAARIGKSIEKSVIAYSHADSSRVSSSQFLNSVLGNKAPVSPGAVLIRTVDLEKNLHTTFETSTPRNFDKNGAGPDVMVLLLTANSYKYVANVSTALVYFCSHEKSFSTENKNNLVAKNYHSAISLYLINNHGFKLWLDYVSYSWLQQMKFDGKWISPKNHLREYEGRGTILEMICGFIFSLKHLLNKYVFKFVKLKFHDIKY